MMADGAVHAWIVIAFETVVVFPLESVSLMLAFVLLDVFTNPNVRETLDLDAPDKLMLLVTELIVTSIFVNEDDFRAVNVEKLNTS